MRGSVDGGMSIRCSLGVRRVPPAVFAIARATPRAGVVPEMEGVRSARVMPLAVAALGLRHAWLILLFPFPLDAASGEGSRGNFMVGGCHQWTPVLR